MRTKIHIQPSFPFIRNTIPQEYADYRRRYEKLDRLLDDNPDIINLCSC